MSPSVTPVDPEIMALLKDAAWWRLLGRLFECPTAAWRADIGQLAQEVNCAELGAAVAAALIEATEGQYHSVFGPGGPAPPREVSYHDTLELGSVMSSVAGYYQAFGYQPTLPESPDHVAVEVGFLSYLRFKQAFAVVDREPDHARVAAAAVETFRTNHLAVMAARLAALLAESPLAYLGTASRLLAGRVGQQPGPKKLTVIQDPIAEEGSEFACDQ